MLSDDSIASHKMRFALKFLLSLCRVLNAVLLACYVCLIYLITQIEGGPDRLLWALGWTVLLLALSYGHLTCKMWVPRYSFCVLFVMLTVQPIEVLPVALEMSEAVYSSFGAVLAYVAVGAFVNLIVSQWFFDHVEKIVHTIAQCELGNFDG